MTARKKTFVARDGSRFIDPQVNKESPPWGSHQGDQNERQAQPAGLDGIAGTGRADDAHDLKAWTLIEDAGLKGATMGGAQMSSKHANFLINAGGAKAADLEELGEFVRKRVLDFSGIELEWEIMRVGRESPL